MATKRPFGTSFAGFWTKKVGAFDSQLWAKKTVVFVDHIGLTQGISDQSLVARQSRLKPVLKDISAAIWSLPSVLPLHEIGPIIADLVAGQPS